ncbi:MAG: DoxX family membrane protein [bacterium]
MKQSKRLRYTVVGARVLLGLIFFVFGFGYFFMKIPPFDMTTPMGKFASGLMASGYFFPFLKGTEGVMGLLLLLNRWTPVALLILAPIILNILLFLSFLDPAGLPIALLNVVLAVFLAWANWDKYKGLFRE